MIAITLTDEDAQAYLDREETVSIDKYLEVVKQFTEDEKKLELLTTENQELRNKLQGMEVLFKTNSDTPTTKKFDTSAISSTGNIKAREARELQPTDSPLKTKYRNLQAEKSKQKHSPRLSWKSDSERNKCDRKLVDYAYYSPNKSERSVELLHRKMPHRSIKAIMDYCYRTYPGVKFKDGYIVRN